LWHNCALASRGKNQAPKLWQ